MLSKLPTKPSQFGDLGEPSQRTRASREPYVSIFGTETTEQAATTMAAVEVTLALEGSFTRVIETPAATAEPVAESQPNLQTGQTNDN